MNELVEHFFRNLYIGLSLGTFYFDDVGIFIPLILLFHKNLRKSMHLLFLVLLGKLSVFLFFATFCIKYLYLVSIEDYNYIYLKAFIYIILIIIGLFLLLFHKKKYKFFNFYYFVFFIFGFLIGFVPDIKYKIFFADNILYNDNYIIKILFTFFYALGAFFLSPYIFFVFLFGFIFDRIKEISISFYIKSMFFKYVRIFCGILTLMLGFYNLYLLKD